MTSGGKGSLSRIWRYYQAGILNTAVGYAVYALLIKLGIWMYAAQLFAHVIGVIFNYFTYSRHAFADREASKSRFAISYAVNYLLGFACLFAAAHLTKSPYLAGLMSIILVSLANYFILRNFVFISHPGTESER